MKIGHVAGVLVVMIALVPSSPAQENLPGERMAPSDATWSAIKACAGIAKDKDRHVCLDDALRNAGLMPAHPTAARAPAAGTAPAAGAVASAAAAGSAVPAAPASDSASPTQSKDAEFGLQPKTFRAPAAARKLQVTLSQVDQVEGKLLLTTTEGAVWKQVESNEVWPVPTEGQTMTIQSGSFGGYFCEPSKHVSFRCYRAK